MKQLHKFAFLLTLISALFIGTACEDDDPEIPNPEELITTLRMQLTPTAGGAAVTLEFRDLDGEGGNDPTITDGTLAANTTYTGSLELLNESETPVEIITEEIEEEDEEHQFFFSIGGGLDLTVAYDDADSDGNPLGVSTIVTTGAASSGTLTVVLRHEPAKDASGVRDGDITNAGGETDIEVEFPVMVQ